MTVFLAILAVLAIAFIVVYNKLIKLKNRADEAWADILTLLKQRYDMIPNMVNVVKGYAKHEKDIFEKVAELRTVAQGVKTPEDAKKADNMFESTLKSLFAVAENYPELKANENFLHLQNTLKDLEDTIQKARRYYNAVVRDYNNALMVFPNNLIAGILGFKKRDYYEVPEEETENVKVEF